MTLKRLKFVTVASCARSLVVVVVRIDEQSQQTTLSLTGVVKKKEQGEGGREGVLTASSSLFTSSCSYLFFVLL